MLFLNTLTTIAVLSAAFAVAQTSTPTPPAKTPETKESQPTRSENVIEIPINRPSKLPRVNNSPPEQDHSSNDQGRSADAAGGIQILSDTKGVDFGPYIRRVHVVVQDKWYPVIPEIALPPVMKSGTVVIRLAIMRDGSLHQEMKIEQSSGDPALDRAAYSALKMSVPFPHLPVEFTGNYLLIRCVFQYNPRKAAPSPSPSPDKLPSEKN